MAYESFLDRARAEKAKMGPEQWQLETLYNVLRYNVEALPNRENREALKRFCEQNPGLTQARVVLY